MTNDYEFSSAPVMINKSILNDKRITELSDRLWRRYIELKLISGAYNKIPEIDDAAWILRVNRDELENDIEELESNGLISYTSDLLPLRKIIEKEVHNNNSGVYLIKSELGYYKIGYSSDIDRRFKNLNSLTPAKLEIIHKINVVDYRTLESRLHMMYDKKRLSGEWFDLNNDDVKFIMSLDEEKVEKLWPTGA